MTETEDAAFHVGLDIRWRQFRGFDDTGWIQLRALTVLLGANGSGKTSLIAPLLLLKQSLASQTGRNPLLTRGKYVNVGSYQDFAYNHRLDADVSFALRWHTHPRSHAKRPPGEYPPGGVEVRFDPGDDAQSVRLTFYRVEDLFRRTMLRRTLQSAGRYSLNIARTPEGARRAGKGPKAKVNKAIRAAARAARPVDFLFTSDAVRREATQVQSAGDSPSFPAQLDDDRTRYYCQIVVLVEAQVEALADDMHYLGPLREPPGVSMNCRVRHPPTSVRAARTRPSSCIGGAAIRTV